MVTVYDKGELSPFFFCIEAAASRVRMVLQKALLTALKLSDKLLRPLDFRAAARCPIPHDRSVSRIKGASFHLARSSSVPAALRLYPHPGPCQQAARLEPSIPHRRNQPAVSPDDEGERKQERTPHARQVANSPADALVHFLDRAAPLGGFCLQVPLLVLVTPVRR